MVRDEQRPVEERRFALRFLIHLVEDLHMPLHVGDNADKGGNRTQVRFFDKGTNMHRLWDSDLIERVSGSEEFWLDDLAKLDTQEQREAAAKGTVEDWATESLRGAGGVSGAGNRRDAETGAKARGCVSQGESAGGARAALPGGHAAGDGAQRGVS